VDDLPRRQLVAASDARFTGGATADPATLFQELRPCGAVNGAIDAAAAHERRVRGVDDGIQRLRRDVALHRLERAHARRM
jgi:hypothetical protein